MDCIIQVMQNDNQDGNYNFELSIKDPNDEIFGSFQVVVTEWSPYGK